MQYIAEIASIQGDTIKVVITTPSTGTDKELVLAANEPVKIDYEQDEVFKPLKMSACSVRVLTEEPLFDIYTGTLNQVTLHVYRNTSLIWFGFLTPNVYSSPYEDAWDELTLEFVDPLSAMENVKYKRVANGQWRSFQQTINDALGKLSASLAVEAASVTSLELGKLGCMERNYIDETDDDDEAMTYQEVMEHICRYLNRQAWMDGQTLRFHDPKAGGTSAGSISTIGIAEGGGTIALGSVYNRVTVVENTNPIDDVLDTELLEDGNMDSVMWEHIDNPYWDNDVKAYNVQMEKDDTTYTDLRAMYRPKTASGWWMKGSGLIAAVGDSETRAMAGEDNSVKDGLGNYVERGAFAFYGANYDNSSVPTKLSFQKSVMMFVAWTSMWDKRYVPGIQDEVFLKYSKTDHNLVLKGGYLVLSMKYKYYTVPMSSFEKSQIDSQTKASGFVYTYNLIAKQHSGYPLLDTTGRDPFKAKLRIGTKYWNGSAWTTTESWFSLVHTWKDGENLFNNEAKLDNTNSYRLRLGDDLEGLAIPIGNNELFGDVEFQLCPPSYFGKYASTGIMAVEPYTGCCEITDLQLAYAQQTSAEAGLVLDTDTKNSDIKVTGTMNAQNIFDMDDIEMKVNTWSNIENSYSYVIRKDSSGNMSYNIPATKPEVELINRLIDYYSQPRMQFSIHLKDNGTLKPTSTVSIPVFKKTFSVGTISYDLQQNSADVTLLEHHDNND